MIDVSETSFANHHAKTAATTPWTVFVLSKRRKWDSVRYAFALLNPFERPDDYRSPLFRPNKPSYAAADDPLFISIETIFDGPANNVGEPVVLRKHGR